MSFETHMPLGFMNSGESGFIEEIKGIGNTSGDCGIEHPHKIIKKKHFGVLPSHAKRRQKLENRLNCMGVIPGEVIQMIKNSPPGPVIVAIKDTRLVLDRALACKIMISRYPEPCLDDLD